MWIFLIFPRLLQNTLQLGVLWCCEGWDWNWNHSRQSPLRFSFSTTIFSIILRTSGKKSTHLVEETFWPRGHEVVEDRAASCTLSHHRHLSQKITLKKIKLSAPKILTMAGIPGVPYYIYISQNTYPSILNSSYPGRVSTKKCNVGLHNLQGHQLVQQTLVARDLGEQCLENISGCVCLATTSGVPRERNPKAPPR